MDSSDYSRGDKLLHHLVLGSPLVSKMSFEVDSLLGGVKKPIQDKHVFVSGLARAGTTILMRLLYETGQFSSLTYRDMPFVLMPRLWRKLSSAWWKGMAATERAHGDGILVDYDSPEAFEEVFWRVFAGERYISANHLRPHPADGELIEQFRIYIGNILSASAVVPGSRRYLSKNNNNILRLPAIRKAFPNSLIIIPFREPVAQAMSLLNQHRKFCAVQQQDRFTQDYMQWLAHHEFGLSHKPFIFSAESESRLGNLESDSLEYWLEIWIGTYQHLAATSINCRFLCYEDLCANPAQTLAPHFYSADIELNADQINRTIRCATTATSINIDQDIEARADKVYSQMRELANIHY